MCNKTLGEFRGPGRKGRGESGGGGRTDLAKVPKQRAPHGGGHLAALTSKSCDRTRMPVSEKTRGAGPDCCGRGIGLNDRSGRGRVRASGAGQRAGFYPVKEG